MLQYFICNPSYIFHMHEGHFILQCFTDVCLFFLGVMLYLALYSGPSIIHAVNSHPLCRTKSCIAIDKSVCVCVCVCVCVVEDVMCPVLLTI